MTTRKNVDRLRKKVKSPGDLAKLLRENANELEGGNEKTQKKVMCKRSILLA